jgi:multisubunit Na+/H+ antiporter MnhG subunit
MVFLGAMPLLLASALTGNKGVVLRVLLIAFFLVVTTPVSAHMAQGPLTSGVKRCALPKLWTSRAVSSGDGSCGLDPGRRQ